MAYPYFAQAALEARIGAKTLARLADDNRDGSADATVVAQLIADGCAKVAGALRGIYSLDAVAADPPPEVVRLSLDATVAYAAQRHPEVMRRDWRPLMKQLDEDLDRLRIGKRRLDVEGSPEPAANEGGDVLSGDPDDPDPKDHVFLGGMGDFS